MVYAEALTHRVVGPPLRSVTIANPFVLRTVDPPPQSLVGHAVTRVTRLAKRLVLHFDHGPCLAMHLMIAGRLHWQRADAGVSRRTLLVLAFESNSLTLTEAGTKRRAAVHVLPGEAALAELDRGGADPLALDLDGFRERLTRENHTLKRALMDQRFLAGIGNAYSDEILLAAQLSPFRQTRELDDAEWARLHRATVKTLDTWIERLRQQCGDGFPEKVTAFRPGMAVHGRYGKPCPICGSPVQRIVYAENEANYCARCQTGGRLLADRALSRLLKASWPKTLDELED